MPELQGLHEAYRDDGVQVIGVNIAESPQVVRAWVNALNLRFPVVLDTDGVVMTRYQVLGQPSTYVITPDGIISHVFYGAVDLPTLRGALNLPP
jgi:peroxiredoxin